MKRILISGSRDWDDNVFIERAIISAMNLLFPSASPFDCGHWDDVTVVHGDCPTGADSIANSFCIRNSVPVERHPADWEQFGKRAGYLRNQEMVDAGADIVLVFNKNSSRGASMTAKLAREAGLPVIEYRVGD